jgi:hypothetical protein
MVGEEGAAAAAAIRVAESAPRQTALRQASAAAIPARMPIKVAGGVLARNETFEQLDAAQADEDSDDAANGEEGTEGGGQEAVEQPEEESEEEDEDEGEEAGEDEDEEEDGSSVENDGPSASTAASAGTGEGATQRGGRPLRVEALSRAELEVAVAEELAEARESIAQAATRILEDPEKVCALTLAAAVCRAASNSCSLMLLLPLLRA